MALIYHLTNGEDGRVSTDAFEARKRWYGYLESHARRIYASVLKPEIDKVRNLAEHLEDGDMDNGFTVRDLYRKGWKGLSSKEGATSATQELIALDWLKVESVDSGGRPTVRHHINSKIRG